MDIVIRTSPNHPARLFRRSNYWKSSPVAQIYYANHRSSYGRFKLLKSGKVATPSMTEGELQ